MLCGDRDETINHTISESSKLAQIECKTRQDLVFKNLKVDHMNKCYMHNTEPILDNETHKILSDFDIQTDQLASAKRPEQGIVNKKKAC